MILERPRLLIAISVLRLSLDLEPLGNVLEVHGKQHMPIFNFFSPLTKGRATCTPPFATCTPPSLELGVVALREEPPRSGRRRHG